MFTPTHNATKYCIPEHSCKQRKLPVLQASRECPAATRYSRASISAGPRASSQRPSGSAGRVHANLEHKANICWLTDTKDSRDVTSSWAKHLIRRPKSLCQPGGHQGGSLDGLPKLLSATSPVPPVPATARPNQPSPDRPTPTFTSHVQPPCSLSFRILHLLLLLLLPPIRNGVIKCVPKPGGSVPGDTFGGTCCYSNEVRY